MGAKASDNLRIRGVPLMYLTKAVFLNFPRAWMAVWRVLDRRRAGVRRHIDLSESILQRLVVFSYGEWVPTLNVPRDVPEIGEIVRGTSPSLNFGREQFRREVFPAELADIATRRTALHLDATLLKGAPSANHGVVGHALSGGGIRSAAFALGAVQAHGTSPLSPDGRLHFHGFWRRVHRSGNQLPAQRCRCLGTRFFLSLAIGDARSAPVMVINSNTSATASRSPEYRERVFAFGVLASQTSCPALSAVANSHTLTNRCGAASPTPA